MCSKNSYNIVVIMKVKPDFPRLPSILFVSDNLKVFQMCVLCSDYFTESTFVHDVNHLRLSVESTFF